MERWVRKLYELGYTPIPIGGKHGNNSKEPKYFDKDELNFYYDHRPSMDVIEEWIKNGCYHNVALLLGAIHGNIACVDIDDPEVVDFVGLNIQELVDGGCWVVDTPSKGRYHIYLTHHEHIDFGRETNYDVELRAEHNYCVFPPSTKNDGSKWSMLNYSNPDDLKAPKKGDILKFYSKIIEKLAKKHGAENKNVREIKQRKEYDESEECIRKAFEQGAKKGTRTYTIYGLSSWLKQHGIPQDNAEDTILGWFERSCEKGDMTKKQIISHVESAYKGKTTGCTYIRKNTSLCPYDDGKKCMYFKPEKWSMNELMEKYDVYIKDGKDRIVGVNCPNLAILITKEHDYNFISIFDESTKNREIFYYEDGFYHCNGEHVIGGLCVDYLGRWSSEHRKREVAGHIRDMRKFNINRDDIEPPINLINVNNGIYDLNTGIMMDHSPDYIFLNKLPVDYVPNSKCKKILKFFEQVFPKEGSYDNFIPCIQEMFGYTLYRRYNFNRIFMLYGSGRNGKSVCLTLLRNLLGSHSFSSVPLHTIIENDFSGSELYGKLANIAGEVSNKAMQNTDLFKSLSGGDSISGVKKYHGRFNFVNYAKLIFSGNNLPKSTDYSLGFAKRWVIPVFSQTFELGDPRTNPYLGDQLVADKKEMQGLLCWAIDGLNRLLKVGNFSYHTDPEATMSRYQELSNPHIRFIRERTEESVGDFILTDELYGSYLKWSKERQLNIMTKTSFTQAICGIYKGKVSVGKRRYETKQQRAYIGVRWKDEFMPMAHSPQKELV